MSLPVGSFSLILNGHMPFIRHPEHQYNKEERWACSAILESYLPLLSVLDRLERDRVPGSITLSLSPTLVAMMDDELLRGRFEDVVSSLLEHYRTDYQQAQGNPQIQGLAKWHLQYYGRLLQAYQDVYQRDLAGAFAKHAKTGRVELITSITASPILPLVKREANRRAQIEWSVRWFLQRFGFSPSGIWLPECAYEPGLETYLGNLGIRYTLVNSLGLATGDSQPILGAYGPVCSSDGVAFFPLSPGLEKNVWDRWQGYAASPGYRYRKMVGETSNRDSDRPLVRFQRMPLSPSGTYHTAGSPGTQRPLFQPDTAFEQAKEHGTQFVSTLTQQLFQAARNLERAPILCCGFDAELFGNWWFEGPLFIESVLRAAAESGIDASSPSAYLQHYAVQQMSRPAPSSWARGGYFETWLGRDAVWAYRYLHQLEERWCAAIKKNNGKSENTALELALNQSTRELYLAEASDWFVMLERGLSPRYAASRIRDHLKAAERLLQMVELGEIDRDYCKRREQQWTCFSNPAPACCLG